MSLQERYSPKEIEQKWYQIWMENKYFSSHVDDREPYTILMPPPNVTGILHMGHMLNITIQDILIRKARLEGKNACWVPGIDHASIATEAKVVKQLREQNLKKSDLTRDEFMSHAWKWKEEYGGKILKQMQQLGASCDWNRTKFTMDADMSNAVIRIFIDLYKKGKLYRGQRMTNWDPEACTVLSNEEVIFKEEQSQLYYLKYQVEGSEDYLTVATTRPETILGDTALAVHPEDPRFKNFIGKNVFIPLVNRKIPIIADRYVDIEFGTGALKITPAHDSNDYEIGQRHNLQSIDIFTEKAAIREGYGKYSGMDRFELRKYISKELKDSGFLIKKENYTNKVGRSERTDVPVEPRLTLQWFVKMDDLAKIALQAVKNEDIEFHPPHFINMYENWLKEENVRDWCISRQLWWGHRIPAWYYHDEIFVAKTEEEAILQAKEKYGSEFDPTLLHQDEDVLDTWFSSWLWPISVFNGFESKEELSYYYPTQVLVTGWDIIFFWVARMVMSGYEWAPELLGKQASLPFEDVYYTGMVRDNMRRKMSKSLGNSPDAMKLIEKYGADGIRFGMLSSASAGNDIVFDAPIDQKTGAVQNESKLCEQGLNFANKLWNVLKLLKGWEQKGNSENQPSGDELAINWIESLFNQHLEQLNQSYNQYRLSEVVINQYTFIWNQFCSWFLEMIKPPYQESIHPITYEQSIDIFEKILISLHPIMPFITEELYQQLRTRSNNEHIIAAKMPTAMPYNKMLIDRIGLFQSITSKIRELKNQYGIKKSENLDLFVDEKELFEEVKREQNQYEILCKMAQLSSIKLYHTDLDNVLTFNCDVYKFYIQIEKQIDWNEELRKTQEEISYHEGFLKSVEKKLSNESFVNNAPEMVVNKEKQKKEDTLARLDLLRSALHRIEANLNT